MKGQNFAFVKATCIFFATQSTIQIFVENSFVNLSFFHFFLGQGNSNHNAFYAYMSTNLQYPHPDRTFVFDTVRTNVGSGYSNSSGLFTAPHAGTFVFTWTVVVDATSFVFSELAVNNVAVGE